MRYLVEAVTGEGGGPDLDQLPDHVRPYILRYQPDAGGGWSVDVDDLAEVAPLKAAARIGTEAAVRGTDLDDDDLALLATVYPKLTVGMDVKLGEVYSWDGTLVVVRQAHTTQAAWLDRLPPALYTIKRTVPDTGVEQWQAGITVKVGDVLEHEGVSYRVVQAHTTQVGWEPPAVPALWSQVR